MEKLSVIIPNFNTEQFISRCIESIINQSYKNLEVIIVDDCSTDNSLSIINEYASKYNNIKLIVNENNTGAGYSRNRGISVSTGSYIGFVDSDDWVDTNFYTVLMNRAITEQSDIALGGVKTELNNNISSKIRYNFPYENTISAQMAVTLLTKCCNQDAFISPMVTNKIYKKTFLEKYKLEFLDNSYNEDDVFSLFALANANKIAIANECYYHYFQRAQSISHNFSRKHIDDLISAFLYIKNNYNKMPNSMCNNTIYIAYFERCLAWVIRLMYSLIQDDKVQKDMLIYLAKELQDKFSIAEYLQYLDSERIKLFFNIYS